MDKTPVDLATTELLVTLYHFSLTSIQIMLAAFLPICPYAFHLRLLVYTFSFIPLQSGSFLFVFLIYRLLLVP